MSDLEQDIEDLERLEQYDLKKASILANLLDEKIGQQDRFVALRTYMGKTGERYGQSTAVPSWVATHTLEWVGSNLKMGSQMPFMATSIDERGRITVDEHNAEELKQRAPDWTRQPELAAYLLHDRQRKFSTILAVVSPPWVDDNDHPNWGADGRATVGAIRFTSLDTEGNVCVIDLKDTLIYALDGQHRVMGIQGVMNVRDLGFIQIKHRDGTATNKSFTKEDLLDRFRVEIPELQSLLLETITVEYIPAVIAGETREEANRRIRDVFVCINSYAKKTKAGENILLDESDGFSIVARKIATQHPLFASGPDRVNWENNAVSKTSVCLTTLDSIRTVAWHYLPTLEVERYETWRPLFKEQVPLRPTEEELNDAYHELCRFFDLMHDLPVFQRILRGDSVVDVREFPDEKFPSRLGHMLLRPIGQQVLARAVSRVFVEGDMSWEQIRDRLEALDRSGKFELFRERNLWYEVLYNATKRTVIASEGNRSLAERLLAYLLRRGEELSKRREMLKEVMERRMDAKGEKWINFDGDWTDRSVEEVDLPVP